MRKWRHPLFVVLSLLAILALALPSLAWSCPMTGRIGDADTVCRSLRSPAKKCACHCAKPGSKCCKSLSFPTSDTNNNSRKDTSVVHSGSATLSLVTHLSSTAATTHLVAVLPEPPLVIAPHDVIALERTPSHHLLLSQRTYPVSSGRAPPAI